MSDRHVSTDSPAAKPSIKTRRFNVPLVWIVPIVAALVGASMLINNALSAGPQISISFQTAEGLEANKTQVKYKNVVIGKVTAIALSSDRSHVVAKVDLDASERAFTDENSMFWVVRPRIGANGISGVDTLLSGAFIGADAGSSGKTSKNFVGQETPPPITYGEQGKRFTLHTTDLGSLDIGSPIYYRRIQVGQVVSYQLSEDGKGVDVEIFVRSPNDRFVSTDTRFWNASGIDLTVGANGLKVNTQSLSTILSGGIAFVEPKYSPNTQPATEHARFELFGDQEAALAQPDGEPRYIRMNFNQSLRGLEVNAPVEFMGVNIGHVVSVDLDYDTKTMTFPSMVGAVIYPNRLGHANETLLKDQGSEDEKSMARLMATFVEHGLRAQARSANLLTGQLYISLSFIPKATPTPFDLAARPLVIPTVPGSLDKVQGQLEGLVDKISKLPLEDIAKNLNGSLSEMQKTLKQVNGEVLPQMNGALAQTQKTLDTVNSSFAEDSPARQQISNAMDEVQRTARSVRVLSDFLSRNPEALIRGRTAQGKPDSYKASIHSSRDIEPEIQP